LLHRTSSIDDESDIYSEEDQEQETNAFAGHLPAPDHFLFGINDHEKPEKVSGFDDWLEPQCSAWGISGEVILRRLMDSGRLSRSDYKAYRQWNQRRSLSTIESKEPAPRAYRHREPKTYSGTVLCARYLMR